MRTTLRILCCYTPGQLRQKTSDALIRFAMSRAQVFFIEISPDDPYGYGRELQVMWHDSVAHGTDLAVVEQDVVVRPDVIDSFLDCECLYGGHPYSWGTDVGIALGCVRFRHEFTQRYPTVVAEAAARCTWTQLDVVLQRHFLVREHGEQPHICGPAVEHLNPAKQLRPDADPRPLATLPAW